MMNLKKHRHNKRRRIRRRKNDYINSVILDIKSTERISLSIGGSFFDIFFLFDDQVWLIFRVYAAENL